MWLLAGLGNPGDKYAGHRHNIGFMVIDEIARQHNFPAFRSKFQSETSEHRIDNEKVVLLKPQTYMNESGRALQAAMKFYKTDPSRVVVFHDELDLAPGKFRAKLGGGSAGHNGLKSITRHLGTPDYWRARLGIGHPGEKDRVTGYVLSDFAKSEQGRVEDFVYALAKNIDLALKNEFEDYMTKVAAVAPAPSDQKAQKKAQDQKRQDKETKDGV